MPRKVGKSFVLWSTQRIVSKNQRGRENKEEREKAKKAEQRATALKSKDEDTGSDSEPDFDDPYDLE